MRALLDRPELFPDTLKAYIPALKQLYDPKPEFVSKYTSNLLHSKTLSSLDCQKLADYLNAKPGDTSWLIASEGSSASEAQKRRAAALSSRCQLHHHFCCNDINFSAWYENPNNSIIAVDPSFLKLLHFARIEMIFNHLRSPHTKEQKQDTWLTVRPLPPIHTSTCDVFAELDIPHLQLHLCCPVAINDKEEYIINIQDVVSHCAWIEYNPAELVAKIKEPVVALVSLDRE